MKAPDNYEVQDFFIHRTRGDWWVSFYDEDDEIMTHNVDLISNYVYRVDTPVKWARVVAITKWGAKRVVNKFLDGKIKDFKRPVRPLP